jgi:hypothetical protein
MIKAAAPAAASATSHERTLRLCMKPKLLAAIKRVIGRANDMLLLLQE